MSVARVRCSNSSEEHLDSNSSRCRCFSLSSAWDGESIVEIVFVIVNYFSTSFLFDHDRANCPLNGLPNQDFDLSA